MTTYTGTWPLVRAALRRDRVVASSWVLLMPSVREGWGIAVMEAAALGVPAIAYRDAGGVTESIVDHVTGHLVDDVDDLVTDDAADPDELDRIRRHGVRVHTVAVPG